VQRLEGRTVEEPDGQSANRDDAKKDQDEGDVRLTLWIVLREAVHLNRRPPVRASPHRRNPRFCGAEGDRIPDLMSRTHETEF